jgi:hypothetical protein
VRGAVQACCAAATWPAVGAPAPELGSVPPGSRVAGCLAAGYAGGALPATRVATTTGKEVEAEKPNRLSAKCAIATAGATTLSRK